MVFLALIKMFDRLQTRNTDFLDFKPLILLA